MKKKHIKGGPLKQIREALRAEEKGRGRKRSRERRQRKGERDRERERNSDEKGLIS